MENTLKTVEIIQSDESERLSNSHHAWISANDFLEEAEKEFIKILGDQYTVVVNLWDSIDELTGCAVIYMNIPTPDELSPDYTNSDYTQDIMPKVNSFIGKGFGKLYQEIEELYNEFEFGGRTSVRISTLKRLIATLKTYVDIMKFKLFNNLA